MALFSGISDSSFGWMVALCSGLLFQCLGVLVSRYFTPDHIKEKRITWDWKNITVSWLHSILCGSLSLICFYRDPKVAADMIDYYSTFSFTVVSFAFGYFVYDSIDTLRFQRDKQALDIMLHHVVVITCVAIAISSERYISYTNVAFLIEVNSIFLHLRQLMKFCQVSRTSIIYRLNCLLNLGTYIVFRIGILAWMTRWILTNKERVPLFLYVVSSLSLAIMTVINIVLFFRLLRSDYLRKAGQSKTHTQ